MDELTRNSTELQAIFMKVEEAARLLGISRSLAYQLANRWIASQHAEGLPCVRMGRRILVPRAALERMAQVDGGP